jgi:CRP-like cAMP-binding protein
MTTRYRFATPVRTPGRVTITHMPRSGRHSTDSPEGDAIDVAAEELTRAEETAEAKRRQLLDAMVQAAQVGMSKAEIARRAGYSREHASKVIAEEIRKHSDSEA